MFIAPGGRWAFSATDASPCQVAVCRPRRDHGLTYYYLLRAQTLARREHHSAVIMPATPFATDAEFLNLVQQLRLNYFWY